MFTKMNPMRYVRAYSAMQWVGKCHASMAVPLMCLGLCVLTGVVKLAYGAALFGMYNEVWDVAPSRSHLNDMWPLALSIWVLSLVMPGLGPFIATCILISWTHKESCKAMQVAFLEEVKKGGMFRNAWLAYIEKHKGVIESRGEAEWFAGYFRARCETPNAVFMTLNIVDCVAIAIAVAAVFVL